MEQNALLNLTYGLFVLTAKDGTKDNGCIINTAMQVTNHPDYIMVAVNKKNYTHDMIVKTGMLNLSVLTEKSTFDTYKRFGFQSGRDTDKLKEINFSRSSNGLVYLTHETNAFISASVVQTIDLPTHSVFMAQVTESAVLSEDASVSYGFYHKNIKPQTPDKKEKKGFVCTVCGYIFEGDTLPDDFICPLCKHPASDFEPL